MQCGLRPDSVPSTAAADLVYPVHHGLQVAGEGVADAEDARSLAGKGQGRAKLDSFAADRDAGVGHESRDSPVYEEAHQIYARDEEEVASVISSYVCHVQ